MKLSDWAKKQGISYITAWRWFNNGRLPVKAYRSDSGTIIVQDESDTSEQVMGNTQSNDVMSMVLKKTVEYSKNNGTVEDFAAWILSTFSLKLNVGNDSPKYSRVKPKPEDVQKHFQKFIKTDEKPKPNLFVASEETLDEIVRSDGLGNEEKLAASLEVTDDEILQHQLKMAGLPSSNSEDNSFSELFSSGPNSLVTTYDSSAGGIVNRSVDSTPQLNYTGSTVDDTLGSNLSSASVVCNSAGYPTAAGAPQYFANVNLLQSYNTGAVIPSVNLVHTSSLVPESEKIGIAAPVRAKRGRKPAKSFGK